MHDCCFKGDHMLPSSYHTQHTNKSRRKNTHTKGNTIRPTTSSPVKTASAHHDAQLSEVKRLQWLALPVTDNAFVSCLSLER